MPKALKTPQSVCTAVFRRLMQAIETDDDMRRVVGSDNIRSWKGVPGDKNPMSPAAGKAIVRFTPALRQVQWYSPDSFSGILFVTVEMAIGSLCIDDVHDLWDILIKPIIPNASDSKGNNFALDLEPLGAETGEVTPTNPAAVARVDGDAEGYFFATGSFEIKILRSITP